MAAYSVKKYKLNAENHLSQSTRSNERSNIHINVADTRARVLGSEWTGIPQGLDANIVRRDEERGGNLTLE